MKITVRLCFLFFLSFMQCKKVYPPKIETAEKIILQPETSGAKNIRPVIAYHKLFVNLETMHWIHSMESDGTLKVLLALNRVDEEHLCKQDTLIVPDVFLKDLKWYSPFPESLSFLEQVHKIILFSYPFEAFAAYENGDLMRWGQVSMGKKWTPTPTGLFYTNWKSTQAISTVNEDWIMNWYFNLDNFRGVFMHQFDLPGYPASHACIRLLGDDAYWLYHWADQWKLEDDNTILAFGTPVIVFGKYPFGKKRLWLVVQNYNELRRMDEAELLKEVAGFLPLIIERQKQRDSFFKNSI